ncbi:alpha/beta fold hydrolase [Paractinoplanes durhamensis]
MYDQQVRVYQACWQSNPAFLSQLTTANVARDLDRVRQALKLSRISYFGVSWGTLLGAVYRSLYPSSVARMWLDSVVGPNGNRFDVRVHDTLVAQEQQTARWAAWVAERTGTYGLGSTADEVLALVAALKARLDADPVVFSDVPGQTLDGNFISFLATAPGPAWADAAQAMKEMTTARSGEPAPPAVAPIITPPPGESTPPPDDAPEQMNGIANTAILCNDDTGPHDFDTWWSRFQQWQRDFPVTGGFARPTPPCAGWPVPAQPFQLWKAAGSLQMSGHRYESSTPYPWVGQMQSAIGGTVFTVEDDIHGSLVAVADCVERLTAYFRTGRPDGGHCEGVPVAGDEDDETQVAGTRSAVAQLADAQPAGLTATKYDGRTADHGRLTWPGR